MDKYNLERFVEAQSYKYDAAKREIKEGRKQSCWMWYVYPQVQGLGMSDMAKEYAVYSLDEAREYMRHEVLGPRLIEMCELLISLENNDAHEIFGYPDDKKLCSSMTLFAEAVPECSVFERVLDKFFHGKKDERTMEILENRQLR